MDALSLDDPQAVAFADNCSRRPPGQPAMTEYELAAQYRSLKAALNRPVTFERRHFTRIPLPMPLRLTPLDQTGQRLDHLTLTVIGKDISPRGISFFHHGSLPYRRAIVSLHHPEIGQYAAEVDIGWCRFTESGWYVSGARQIRPANRPATSPPADSGVG